MKSREDEGSREGAELWIRKGLYDGLRQSVGHIPTQRAEEARSEDQIARITMLDDWQGGAGICSWCREMSDGK